MFAYATISLVATTAISPAVTAAAEGGGDPPSRFTVTTRKADDSVGVAGDQDRTVFDIKSPSGIGRAVVERRGDAWPKAVVVRLHLKGLESLTVSSGAVGVRAAVGVQDQKVEVRQWTGGREEAPLAADDPLRLAVRALGKDDKPATALPLKDGCFEVTLPAAFFKDNPKSLTVEWIDFYR